MTALTAYALAALRRLNPALSKKVQPATYLVAPQPYDFSEEVARRSTHKMLIARADWRHFREAQLDLFSGLATRSGPKQLGGPPARPRLRTATTTGEAGTAWRWNDEIVDA